MTSALLLIVIVPIVVIAASLQPGLVEDMPIRGKIIDLEGKPIAGVKIQLASPTDGKEGSLDAWLAGIRAGEPAWTVHKKAGTAVEPKLLGIPDEMKSDADGRFEIRGLGLERKIELAFVGEAEAHRKAVACTRKMRFVTSKGEPREGAHSLLNFVVTPGAMPYSEETAAGTLAADQDFVVNHDRLNHGNGPKTDADGRMELPALIPGATYRILGNMKGKQTFKDFTVDVGQTIDLGEIILDRE